MAEHSIFDLYRFAITEADGETAVPEVQVGPRIYTSDPNNKSQNPPPNKTPIHCLPVEILRQIFIHVPATEFYYGSDSMYKVMSLWTSASQVCSLWRRIILETPEFWTFIPLQTRHIQWIDLCLTRSHGLPVSFSINGSFSHLEWYRRAIFHVAPAVSRARELYFATEEGPEESEQVEQLANAIGAHPAPLLEIFECVETSIALPTFGGEVPSRLRRVRLINCYVDQNWPGLFAPLTYLELEACTLSSVLGALRFLPSLRTLILNDTYDFGQQVAQGPQFTRVTLPHLNLVKLFSASSVNILTFLRDVHIPSDADLSFTIYDEFSERNVSWMITSLAQALSDHFHKPLDIGSSFQKIHIGCPDVISMRDSNVAFRISHPTPGSGGQSQSFLPKQIYCEIVSIVDLPHPARFIPPLLSVFGSLVQKPQTLVVDNAMMTHLEEWLAIARRVGEATSQINVHGGAAHGLVMALAATSAQPAFPHLDVLSIERVVFTGPVDDRPERREVGWATWDPVPDRPPEDSVPFIDGLLQALDARAATGHPIRRLTIARCAVTADMVASLRNSQGVVSVEWDGDVRGVERPHWADGDM